MMFLDFYAGLIIFLVGLCVGSFLNCVIFRLSLPGFYFWKDLGSFKNRSYCPECRHPLKWFDLIPIVSFFLLRGRCRQCKKNISIQYPLVELATGIIFLLVAFFSPLGFAWNIKNLLELAILWYVAASLIVIFVYDLRHYLIPDAVLFPAIAAAFIWRFFYSPPIGNYLLAVLVAAGFFLCIFLVSKGNWMGFGDVKLAALMGVLLGFPGVVLALFLSFFFGAIIGAVLIGLKRKGLKSEVPFAPFLIAGTFVVLFFGDAILNWYSHFLLF